MSRSRLVTYLRGDRSKLKARDRYLVSAIDGDWCEIRKFSGSQLRAFAYRIKRHECYRVPDESPILPHHTRPPEEDGGSEADIEQLGTLVLTLPVPPDELMLPAQYNMRGCSSDSTTQSYAQHMEETPIYDSTNPIPKLPNAAEHAPDELIAPCISERIRKQPIHLQDYVL